MTRVIFYFPYQDECGVPHLFLRMSRWLAANHGDKYRCFVGDYVDGAMARYICKDDNVGILVAGDRNNPIVVNDNDILVMQTIVPYYWPKDLKIAPKTKIFFWTVHYRNLIPSLLPFPILRNVPYNHLWLFKTLGSIFYRSLLRRMKVLVDDMTDHGAHFFMDKSTERSTIEHLPLKALEKKKYLPVPASDYWGPLKSGHSNGMINVCFLGRLCMEKTPVVIYSLKKLSEFALKNKIKIKCSILGFGEYTEMVNQLDLENPYFTKFKVRPIKFAEIDDFLLKNIDLMFATGTSALESSKLNIPTILIDGNIKPVKGDYIFRFIYDRREYDLGHILTKDDFEKGNNSFWFCMNEVITNYEQIATKCREYFIKNHSLSSVGVLFKTFIDKCTFTFDMIDPKVISQPRFLRLYNKLRGFDR